MDEVPKKDGQDDLRTMQDLYKTLYDLLLHHKESNERTQKAMLRQFRTSLIIAAIALASLIFTMYFAVWID